MNPSPDPQLCAALRTDLDAAGYRAERVRDLWGPLVDTAVGHGLTEPAHRALAGRTDPLAVLAGLLFLGSSAPRASVDDALPALGSAGLLELGLAHVERDARRGGEVVVADALVRPQDISDAAGEGHWWVASDLDEAAVGGPLPTGHVLGVGGASLTLAGLQLTSRVGRVLDIGTGCGIQALRARRAADAVIATDVSERALAFTRFNALLNGVGGIETRSGSLFEPVAGELFERVVSNPPFVITPRVDGVPEYEYRDGGMAGDELVAAFVRGVGDVLAPGGVAQLLGNWEYREGEDGLDRVGAWVAQSSVALDAWVVEREQLDPLAYAELWVRDGGTAPGSPAYAPLVQAWLDDFAARGVTAIGFGYITLHRPPLIPTLARFERITGSIPGALGPHLDEALAVWQRLSSMTDADLDAAVLSVAPDVTEARHHVPGVEDPQVIELRQGAGFGRVLDVDPALAALVGASDGDLPVGVLIAAIADLLGVEAMALRADLLPRVRELLFTGFLRFSA